MALAAILLASAPAAAQQVSGDDQRPGRIRLGPLYLTPTVSLFNVGLDDNVFINNANRRSDFTATARGETDVRLRMRRLEIGGRAMGEYVFFARSSTERSLNGSGEFRAALRVLRNLFVVGRLDLLSTRQRLSLEIDARARRIENGYRAGLSWQAAPKLIVAAAAGNDIVEFDSDQKFLGTSLRDVLNRDSRAAYVAGFYTLTPLTTVTVTSQWASVRFPYAPLRNTNSWRFTPGVEFKPRALISGTAAIGFRRFQPTSPIVPPFTGLAADMTLTYGTLRGTAITGQFKRDVAYSFETQTPYYVDTSVGVAARRSLGRRMDLNGGFGRHWYGYRALQAGAAPVRGGPGDNALRDSVWTVGVGVGYVPSRNSRLSFDVLYDVRRSDRSVFYNYEQLRLFAGWRKTF